MRKVRTLLLSEYFILIVCGIVCVLLYTTFVRSLSDSFRGTFWGGFSAVVVGIAIFYVKQRVLLQGKRYNALVYFDMKLNTLLSTLSDNQFLIRKGLDSKGLLVIVPHELTLSESWIQEVGRISVKRKLVSLNINLEKYNNSLRTATAGFQRNLEILATDPLGLSSLEKEKLLNAARGEFRRALSEIERFGDMLTDGTEEALVEVRFFLGNDRSRIEGLINWTGSKRPIEHKLNVPIEKIDEWIYKNIAEKDC